MAQIKEILPPTPHDYFIGVRDEFGLLWCGPYKRDMAEHLAEVFDGEIERRESWVEDCPAKLTPEEIDQRATAIVQRKLRDYNTGEPIPDILHTVPKPEWGVLLFALARMEIKDGQRDADS